MKDIVANLPVAHVVEIRVAMIYGTVFTHHVGKREAILFVITLAYLEILRALPCPHVVAIKGFDGDEKFGSLE